MAAGPAGVRMDPTREVPAFLASLDWPRPSELSADACSAHFDTLVAQHGTRHPIEALRRRPRGAAPLTLDALVGASAPAVAGRCEATLLIRNGSIMVHVGRGASRAAAAAVVGNMTHPSRFALLTSLLTGVPRHATVLVGLDTSDLAICMRNRSSGGAVRPAAAGAAPLLLVDSAVPTSFVAETLVVPITARSWFDLVPRAQKERARGMARPNAESSPWGSACYWRGSSTGHERWQARYHFDRGSCQPHENNRDCTVRRGDTAGAGHLNASFGKSPSLLDKRWTPPCIVALDGHSYPSLLPFALLKGSLVTRVGGFDEAAPSGSEEQRASEFVWFEPLLREGIHYVRAHGVDSLASKVEELFTDKGTTAAATARARIATAGHAAAVALFSAKSVVCFLVLGFEELARDHATAIAQAEARLDEFAPVSQPPKRHHSAGKVLQHTS